MSIAVRDISKVYGGLKAVDAVSFTAANHKITSVIGPNGAGKTTLLNLISGVVPPSAGQVSIDDKDMTGKPPHALATAGLSRTFQNPQLFEGMSVLETVMVGTHRFATTGLLTTLFRLPRAVREDRMQRDRASAALRYVGIPAAMHGRMALELAYGDQRRIEIARTIAMGAKNFLLDEPAAGLNPTETTELSGLICKLRADGHCVVLIEHDMEMVMSISDHVVVMNFGQKIAQGTPDEVQGHPAVIDAYLGVEETDA